MNEREAMCPLCDGYHVPGKCPDGLKIELKFCPRCREQGRGDGLLVTTAGVQACVSCGFGTRKAPKPVRKRGRRGGRVRR